MIALPPVFDRWTTPVYPQLGPGERALTEVRLGGDTAVLTDRRVVVTGANFEQSLPLAHIALVRVRFERIAGNLVFAAIAILVAIVLFAIAGPSRTFLIGQAATLEPAAQSERDNAEGASIAQGMQRLLRRTAAVVAVLPAIAWLLLLVAAAKIALGVLGRTVVTIAAGGGEIEFEKRGRDRALHEFIAEVGRALPGPGRPHA